VDATNWMLWGEPCLCPCCSCLPLPLLSVFLLPVPPCGCQERRGRVHYREVLNAACTRTEGRPHANSHQGRLRSAKTTLKRTQIAMTALEEDPGRMTLEGVLYSMRKLTAAYLDLAAAAGRDPRRP